MSRIRLILAIPLLIFILPSTAQRSFRFSRETAHPNAKALMNEEFFWSAIDESGPFGSDGGSDAAYGFYQWRKEHPLGSPITYLKELFTSWAYPQLAWDELDTVEIKRFISLPAHPDPATVEQTIRAIKQNQNSTPATKGQKKLTDEEIRQLILDGSKNMGITYLSDEDEAIIGTAFAQIVMEGKIDPILKVHAQNTLKREMLPIMIRNFGNQGQQNLHKEKLTKMLKVVEKIHS